ncbi:unnamed protein product, partial [Prorocentrum cordatum]
MGESEGGPAPCGEFSCCKCELVLPLTEKDTSDDEKNKTQCKLCKRAYKALTRRWQKNKKLQAWWNSKSKDAQIEWYQTARRDNVDKIGNQELKLDLEMIETKGTESRRRVHYKPFDQYKKDLFMEGFSTLIAQQNEFRRRTQDPKYMVRKIGGEYHIGEYMGVVEDELHGQLAVNKVRSTAKQFTSAEELAEERERLQGLFQEAGSAITEASSSVGVGSVTENVLGDMPQSWIAGFIEEGEATSMPDSCRIFDLFHKDLESKREQVERELEEAFEAEMFEGPQKYVDPLIARSTLSEAIEKAKGKASSLHDSAELERTVTIDELKQRLGLGEAALEGDWAELVKRMEVAKKESEKAKDELITSGDEMLESAKGNPDFDFANAKATLKQLVADYTKPEGAYRRFKKTISDSQRSISKQLATELRTSTAKPPKARADLGTGGSGGAESAKSFADILGAYFTSVHESPVGCTSSLQEADWQRGALIVGTEFEAKVA